MTREPLEKIKLSIIVPVYNVEQWLDRCVRSIVSQNLSNYELILVNDGSPDTCPQKCDEWAENDHHIRVVHKKNGGQSDARNAGIDIAQGDYLTFVDSDDYLEQGIYKHVIDMLTEDTSIDMVEFSAREFVGGKKERTLKLEDKNYSNADDYWLNAKAYSHAYAWNKIYRRSLFDKVRYPKGIVFEDVYTLPKILSHTKHIATTSRLGYVYCWNSEGITSTSSGREMKMLLNAHLPIINDYIGKKNMQTKLKKKVAEYYMHVLNIQITTYILANEKPQLPYFAASYSKGMSLQTIAKLLLLRLMGVNGLCKVMKTIKKLAK